ncbi:MAG: hypothetical protein H0W76_16130 [Pyrinomonadaceae bacterium]|nr:hypothetical protein [Pyrinomonadaceae bacterium]
MGWQQTLKQAKLATESEKHLYTLEVFIVSGPMAQSFVKKHKVISRTIQMREDQTLEELHHAIFSAFDREEEHMYEFQVGGKGPMDPAAQRYVLGLYDGDAGQEARVAGDVERTTIGALRLKENEAFGYWFDFGDDWWHQINILAIEEKVGRGKYPKVTKLVGKSPPQYVDWDEEEE